jgi:hypothetical protein
MFGRDDPGDQVLMRALTVASDRGRRAEPVDLLSALAEVDGPLGAALAPAGGGVLLPDAAPKPGFRGGGTGYRLIQVMGAAQDWAASRQETEGPAHLLVAVVDQADPAVYAALDPAEVRSVALGLLGAPPDLPRLPLPALIPAGTLDRPPLEIGQLDPAAWAALRHRQDRLPLGRLRRAWHWEALSHLEERAALRVADRLGVDEDQRYSLLSRHHDRVEALAHAARPDLVVTRSQMRAQSRSGPMYAVGGLRRPRRGARLPRFMIGWPTWFSNRKVGLRDKYFGLTTALPLGRTPRPSPGSSPEPPVSPAE